MLREYLALTPEHMLQEGVFSLLIFNSYKMQQACGRGGGREGYETSIVCLAVTIPSPSQRSCLISMQTERDGQLSNMVFHYPGLR